jgi:Fe-S-cluster containining protein
VADPRLQAVWTAIDEAFGRTIERHPEELLCQSGCGDCCGRVGGLTIAAYEADVIREWLRTLNEADKQRIRSLAEREEGVGCVLLDDDARCSIYPARPLVCRAFGLPYRVVPELVFPDGKRRLRVLEGGALESEERVERTCMKNFLQHRTEDIPADEVIDQPFLNATAARFNEGRNERYVLSQVVREELGIIMPPTAPSHDP